MSGFLEIGFYCWRLCDASLAHVTTIPSNRQCGLAWLSQLLHTRPLVSAPQVSVDPRYTGNKHLSNSLHSTIHTTQQEATYLSSSLHILHKAGAIQVSLEIAIRAACLFGKDTSPSCLKPTCLR